MLQSAKNFAWIPVFVIVKSLLEQRLNQIPGLWGARKRAEAAETAEQISAPYLWNVLGPRFSPLINKIARQEEQLIKISRPLRWLKIKLYELRAIKYGFACDELFFSGGNGRACLPYTISSMQSRRFEIHKFKHPRVKREPWQHASTPHVTNIIYPHVETWKMHQEAHPHFQ